MRLLWIVLHTYISAQGIRSISATVRMCVKFSVQRKHLIDDIINHRCT
jgi:hypothetical protein